MPNPTSNIQHPTSVAPYTALAAGYDLVMAHVDYALWAEYVLALLEQHHPAARSILELGCGTGSLALLLQPLGPYRYVATDGSEAMIRVARQKADREGVAVRFAVSDFTRSDLTEPADVLLLLYDGLNYVLDPASVAAVLEGACDALHDGGLFLFDQSTPANSLNNEAFFDDTGEGPGFSYARSSRYDPATHLHTTTFDLHVDGRAFHEEHVQRAYDLDEMRALVQASPFDEVAAYDGFSTEPASQASERIHWVLRRPSR